MAIMHPSKLNREITDDPMRSSEVKVYNLLQQQLDDQHHVFYSSPWLGTRSDGSEIDGEADFIVVHADKGYLALEVKGGRISLDKDGNWFSRDRHNITRKIKDPTKQAMSSDHQILEKLKKRPELKYRFIGSGWGVILPDVDKPDGDLRPNMPPEKFACAPQLKTMANWIDAQFNKAKADRRFQPLGADGLQAFIDMLTKEITLNINIRKNIEDDLQEIQSKTAEQIWLLRELEENQRMKIAGAAGTGKTILALEKALMLAEEGKRTLLLCFNRPLSIWLKNCVQDLKQNGLITAMNFHQLCRETALAAKIDVSNRSPDDLANHLVDYLAESDFEPYDALILDEGQDFKDDWLTALEMVVKDGDQGTLYVFHDNNQKVMGASHSYFEKLKSASHVLSRNFRNTRKIFDLASFYYNGKPIKPIGPLGEDVTPHVLGRNESVKEAVANRVVELIRQNRVKPEDLVILCPDQDTVDLVRSAQRNQIAQIPCSNAEERAPGKIVVDTIRRFKGLESPMVLLVLDRASGENTELLYTGVTRAQSMLEIFAPSSVLESLKDLIK